MRLLVEECRDANRFRHNPNESKIDGESIFDDVKMFVDDLWRNEDLMVLVDETAM